MTRTKKRTKSCGKLAVQAGDWQRCRKQHAKFVCMCSENEDLSHGAILRGTLEEGSGQQSPQEGDLVGYRLSACNA